MICHRVNTPWRSQGIPTIVGCENEFTIPERQARQPTVANH